MLRGVLVELVPLAALAAWLTTLANDMQSNESLLAHRHPSPLRRETCNL